MGKYDFETIYNRTGTQSIKWDVKEGVLPRWIADRDFPAAPEIVSALSKRVDEGIFGYTSPHEDWYKAYRDFFFRHHRLSLSKDWLVFSLGVVPTISSSVRKLTKKGDQVVLLTPVYNIFYNSILNNGRIVREVPLIYQDGRYSVDFPSLEQALKEEKTTRRILCNPANPVGRIFSKEDLRKIGHLCKENSVVVLSDEIHGEITRPGREYTPFFSVSEENRENSVTAVSVTKAFNLAGIQTSAILIPNPELRKKVVRQINTDEVAEPNVFSCVAAVAALNKGDGWLRERREKVFANREYASSFLKKEIPMVSLVKGDATYLLWIDVSKVTKDSLSLARFLKEKAGLYLEEGDVYGKGGQGFLRRNVACPLPLVKEGLRRLKAGIALFSKEAKA